VTSKTQSASTVEQQANRFRTLSRLADDLAHEIKNPLHAMVINLELLKKRIDTGAKEQALERVALLEQEVRRAHELIDRVLQLMRPSRQGEDQPAFELDSAVEEIYPVLELKTRLSRVELTTNLQAQGAPLSIPRSVVQQTLLNVFSNALSAMPDGGRMDISTRRTLEGVTLTVSDSGPGLSRGVFEQATTDRLPPSADGEERSGLAVTRALLEGVGGRLELGTSGVEGSGASLILVFPRGSAA
jgi:signal transduction histidine kinase